MSTISLLQSTVVFPVNQPDSISPPQSIGIVNQGEEPVNVTISIQNGSTPYASAFSAELFSTQIERSLSGGVYSISTPIGTTAAIPPTPQSGQSIYSPSTLIQVSFFTPADPVPGFFDAVLLVTWSDGSSTVSLSGTTAQFKAYLDGPITILAGNSATAALSLEYFSLDPSPLTVQIAETNWPTAFPAGLQVSPVSATMLPVFVVKSKDPKQPRPPEPPGLGGAVEWQLVTSRYLSVPITISSRSGQAQPGPYNAYLQYSLPSQPILGTNELLGIAINVLPLPINLSIVESQPVAVVKGSSAQITLSVKDPGVGTFLKFDTLSGDPGITVQEPDWVTNGEIGIGGDGNAARQTPLTISVADDGSLSPPFEATLNLPWTANNGLSQGTLSVNLEILPSAIAFESGLLGALGVSGMAQWTLNAQGYWNYTGSVTNSEILSTNYSFGIALNITDSQGNYPAVVYSATVAPDLPFFSNTDSWNVSGYDPRIIELWPAIVKARSVSKISAATNALDAVLEGLIALVGGGAAAVAITLFFTSGNVSCTASISPTTDDKGGVGIEAQLN
jgi:hypothetical protein